MNQTPDPSSPSKFDSFVARLPLLWLSLAFLVGIVAARYVAMSVRAWLLLACLFVLFAIVVVGFFFRLKQNPAGIDPANWFIASISLVTLCLGAARYQAAQPSFDPSQIAWYNDREYDLLVTGTVASPPDVRDTYTNLRIDVTAVDTGEGDIPASGLLLARVANGEDWPYGEVIRLRGEVKTPPESDEFSYRDYLARRGIHSYMTFAEVTRLPFPRSGKAVLSWIYDLKAKALDNIYEIFPDPEASLLGGILLGVDTGLSAKLQQAFRNTGTAHIIAISGFNVAIIASFFMIFFTRLLGRRRGPWLAIVMIVIYTILVGAEASVVRAAIMGGLGLFARQVGRRQTAIVTLAFTAAVMCLVNPYMPWDVGFQLSFFATLGLVFYAESLQQWAVRVFSKFSVPETAIKIAKPVTEYFLLTLAAQLTILPVIAWHFGRISLISLIVNPLILPVQPAVMSLGGLALLASFVYMPLGNILAWAAWPFATYTIRLVELFDRIPQGTIILGEFSLLFLLGFYLVLLLWTFSKGILRTTLRTFATPTILVGVLGIFMLLSWNAVLTQPDGKLHITFLDVGSADAVLLETPEGRNILINGGGSVSRLSDGLGRRLSVYHRSLDWVIVASPQEEQISALTSVLERFHPENILWAGNTEASYSALRLDEWATEKNVPVTLAQKGYTLDLGYGGRLEAVSVSSRGAVLLITWGDFRALLPIGFNFDSLEELDYGEEIGEVDVLLLAESGYEPLNRGDWFGNLKPQAFILDVAANDESGLPDEKVLGLTEGRTLLRTDQNGWIEITTDGKQFSIEVEKK